ncbi:RNA methyltransferase [Aliikangiella maris]|uniref:tRNA (cytidine/uridine-2'-O-)-methyltransferase TrmJ n=2 Tax=Aliikangiella maris TaxID=3162458 RepID=A0ABV3MIQ9_9GAMM
MLENFKFVLSHTTHPGNIGASARALKVMGLSQLALVNPSNFPSAQATERASRADDILASAQVFVTVEEAVADCRLVVGTSARTRTLPSQLVTPRELVELILQQPARVPVAILFGTENSGLTNDELHMCNYHVCIPTNPEYSSLNLASAVQLIAYELRLGFAQTPELPEQRILDNEQPISREQLSGLLEHFDEAMRKTGYLKQNHEKQIDIRMNRLFSKANLTHSEMNILRGFLRSVLYRCQ